MGAASGTHRPQKWMHMASIWIRHDKVRAIWRELFDTDILEKGGFQCFVEIYVVWRAEETLGYLISWVKCQSLEFLNVFCYLQKHYFKQAWPPYTLETGNKVTPLLRPLTNISLIFNDSFAHYALTRCYATIFTDLIQYRIPYEGLFCFNGSFRVCD